MTEIFSRLVRSLPDRRARVAFNRPEETVSTSPTRRKTTSEFLQPRRNPRQQRAQIRTQRILDVTAKLLDKVGIDSLTTLMIARELDISVGSLYHYFPNKHAILNHLGMMWLEEMTTAIEDIENMASLTLDYSQPLANGPFSGVNYHVNGYYRSKADSSFQGIRFFEIDASSIWDASATLHSSSETWSVTGFVDNVFDELGVTGGIPAARNGPVGQFYFVTRPRSYGIRFTYHAE